MKKPKSTALGFASVGALGLFAAASGVAPASQAQALSTLCPARGFDICFPNLDSGAPNAACAVASSSAAQAGGVGAASAAGVTAADAVAITACLSRVCRNEASEPVPGFFEYCCARGGSERYDDFCVLAVQNECSAVAELCDDRCPPLELLLGTVTLAPPPAACLLGTYPLFVGVVCRADPFCCETSWDSICADEAAAVSR